MKEIAIVVAVVALSFAGIVFFLKADPASQTTGLPQAVTSFPEPSGHVVDSASVLKSETRMALESDLTAYHEIAEIAVVTVPTFAPEGSIEDYAYKLFEKWGIGEKDTDNGVLLLIAVEDREVRIESGRGIEAKITDAEAGRILDTEVIPHLKRGDWDAGVIAGVAAIKDKVK